MPEEILSIRNKKNFIQTYCINEQDKALSLFNKNRQPELKNKISNNGVINPNSFHYLAPEDPSENDFVDNTVEISVDIKN